MHGIQFKIVCFLLFTLSNCTLGPSDRRSRKVKKKDIQQQESLVQSDENINYHDIIKEHKSYSISQALLRNFNGEILGYVTPWNNHGYEISKLFGAKFTLISPVWLQIKPSESTGKISVGGLHDIDKNWLAAVKSANEHIKIVPRIIFEKWTFPLLQRLLKTKELTDVFSELIALAKINYFNGYVIEIWSLLGGQLKMELTEFLKRLASVFSENDLEFILAIPPPLYYGGQVGMFVKEDFENLVDHVTAFSLMTYDYSSPQRPGPNSPIPWIRQCITVLCPHKANSKRKKILLGLNFYGYIYSTSGGKPLVSHEYIALLQKTKPQISFDNVTGEHSFKFWLENEEHQVFYPTINSIQLRLQIAKELGTGIAVWELGQGLDYFYNLL